MVESSQVAAKPQELLTAQEKAAYRRGSLVALLVVVSWGATILAGVLRDEVSQTERNVAFAWLFVSWGILLAVYRCPRCRGYLGSAMGGRYWPKCRVSLRGGR